MRSTRSVVFEARRSLGTVVAVVFGFLGAACSANSGKASAFFTPSGGTTSAGAAPSAGGGASNFGGSSTSTGGDPAFFSGGGAGGTTTIRTIGDGGTPMRMSVALDDCGANNPANLSATDVQSLETGSGGANGLRYLYPYDGTVFPRGLTAPLLMWDGANADAVYVHIHASLFDYKGCLVPTAPGQLALPQQVWDTAGVQTLGPSDPFTIEFSTIASGTVSGPISEKVVIAQATLKGSVYYGSYNSPLAGAFGGGAILRLTPGQTAQFFLRQNTCTGCHAISRNGSRLIAREIGGLVDGEVYGLTPTTAANPTPMRSADSTAFAGIYPDGSVYLGTAVQNGIGPRTSGAIPVIGNIDAALYETDTGNVITGSGIPTTAEMPTFSPDGALLAFTDYAISNGHGLATMSYDATQRKAANYKQVFSDPTLFPGWPFALPDNGALVFADGASSDFSGGGTGIDVGVTGPASDLEIVDLASTTATPMYQAMGFQSAQDLSSNQTYLPYGAEELHHSYYPTVSPAAAGGYFWIFFDSMRHYGNKGMARQLWGTALTISADGKYAGDPSHPPFYLPGQEFETANHRAFTALDPCLADGAPCTSGTDCCNGFCTNGICGVPNEPRCSQTGEACKKSSDCCDATDSCIGGVCTFILH
ncbi:MAG TPA: hypothetical protein VH142_21385 [Polyangiaceae bacterium]|nr:hypothetical protein [Polyangiaceae bacterium]